MQKFGIHTHIAFCTSNLYAQSVLSNKISASELKGKFVKSALLVGFAKKKPPHLFIVGGKKLVTKSDMYYYSTTVDDFPQKSLFGNWVQNFFFVCVESNVMYVLMTC